MSDPKQNSHQPPRFADRFLAWFCNPELLPEIQGDLHELFQRWVKEYGAKKAKWWYVINVITFLRPFALKRRKEYYTTNRTIMINNHFKIAYRNLRKHSVYSFINMVGLSVGLTACLLVFMFVMHEVSFDTFHQNSDQIYRVAMDLQRPGEEPPNVPSGINTAPNLGPALVSSIPGIEATVRFRKSNAFIQQGEHGFYEDNFLFSDPSVLDVFSFHMLKGNPKTALNEPFTLVLTQEAAHKYFGNQDPMGALLTVDDTLTFKVAGVLASIPANSHIQFDFLTSLETYVSQGGNLDRWWGHDYTTFIKLAEGVNPDQIATQVYNISQQYIAESEDNLGLQQKHFLEPLKDIYLHSQVGNNLGPIGSASHVYIFSAIAALSLLIACINFMNLATAQSSKRAKEVGIRKALGSQRAQLIRQFLSESFLTVLLALLLAIVLLTLSLPFFNQLTGKSLSISTLWTPSLLLTLLGIMIAVSFLAGSYPALVLSSFNPITVLKGNIKLKSGSAWLRKALVIMQFTISVSLIVGTQVVYYQLNFMQNQDLGFDKEQVIVLSGQSQKDFDQHYEMLRQELQQQSNVVKASASSAIPGRRLNRIAYHAEGLPDNEISSMQTLVIDYNFLETYGLELAAGRFFSKASTTDPTEAFILNEAAVKELHWGTPEQAIGKRFEWNLEKEGYVIGVVKDFHHQSLQQKIEPVVMHIQPGWFQYISLKVKTSGMQETLADLEKIWTEVVPDRPFDYFFLDEYFGQQYQTEEKLGSVFGIFTTLAILIACLGLFGLTAFTTEQRTKEIGIRKVLGASVGSILFLLSKDFIKLIFIAFLIAIPISYWFVDKWLEDFAYRINLNPYIFLFAGLATLLLGWFTMSYQSIKAALVNPVDSLRNE